MSAPDLLDAATRALAQARAAGADEADVVVSGSTEFEVKVCDGSIVALNQAQARGLGLRVFVGSRMGFCTTSDFAAVPLAHAAARAVAMARAAEPDPHHGLAAVPADSVVAGPELELYDPAVAALAPAEKIAWAHAIEAAARAEDPRVRKFRDSGVGTTCEQGVLCTSRGTARQIERTQVSAWSIPVAEANGSLQTEVWYDAQAHLEDLEPVESIGRTAARRAARMLGARPVSTQRCAVIFEPAMAAGLLHAMLGALDGDLVRRGASFLAGHLGEQIAAPCVTLTDDPLLPRGGGSAPFDGEGLPTARRHLLDAGRLTTFLYDATTARRAGVLPTGSAQRSHAGLPHAGTFNVSVAAGTAERAAIYRDVPRALLVTRALGQGLDPVTGEYSRGVNGLWLEHGEVVHPVQEVTIAGDYLSMLRGIDAVGRDVLLRAGSGAPTVRIGEMTVSGA